MCGGIVLKELCKTKLSNAAVIILPSSKHKQIEDNFLQSFLKKTMQKQPSNVFTTLEHSKLVKMSWYKYKF